MTLGIWSRSPICNPILAGYNHVQFVGRGSKTSQVMMQHTKFGIGNMARTSVFYDGCHGQSNSGLILVCGTALGQEVSTHQVLYL